MANTGNGIEFVKGNTRMEQYRDIVCSRLNSYVKYGPMRVIALLCRRDHHIQSDLASVIGFHYPSTYIFSAHGSAVGG